jgi:hypothetical protein
MRPPARLLIVTVAVPLLIASKSSAWPLVVEMMVPELFMKTVPLLMLVLMRKASLAELMIAPAWLLSVKLPVVNDPDVSIPRVVAEIVPELSMTTPGAAEPAFQVMPVAADSVPPLRIVPWSLLPTVCAPEAGGTVKSAESAGSVTEKMANALSARADTPLRSEVRDTRTPTVREQTRGHLGAPHYALVT